MRSFFVILFLLTAEVYAQNSFPVPAHLSNDVTQKMGFKDATSGKWVVKPIFDFVKPYGVDGTAVVYTMGKVGFVDTKGKLLFLSSDFDDAEPFNADGVAVVRKRGDNSKVDAHMQVKDKFGLINKSGKLVLPFRFDALNANSFPGTVVAKFKNLWGIMDYSGKMKIDFAYDMINVHKSLQAAVLRRDSLTGVINQNFSFIVPMGNNLARFAGHSLISIFNGNKFGYINFKGETIIPFEYSKFSVFKDGITLNKKNGYYGMIDTLNKVLIPFEYDGGEPLKNDTAIMIKQGKFGIINHKNEILVEFIYDKISRFFYPRPPGNFVLIKSGIFYFLSPETGKPELWEPVIDEKNLFVKPTEKNR